MIDLKATALARAHYNRIAALFDGMEFLMERRAQAWRKRLWGGVPPGRILEVGVGTGKNLPFYPKGTDIRGIDLSERMLARARRDAVAVAVDLREMDVQALGLPRQRLRRGRGDVCVLLDPRPGTGHERTRPRGEARRTDPAS